MVDLLLDTSTERGLIAFASKGELLRALPLPFGLQNSRHILPLLESGLKSEGLEPSDISFIGVGIGPGSYTGIRVGVSVAKMAAFANNIPLLGICSLYCWVPTSDGEFAAVVDARIGGIYFQKGKKEGDCVTYDGPPLLLDCEEAKDELRALQWYVTPSAERLKERLGSLPGKWEEKDPDSVHLSRFLEKQRDAASKEHSLELLYLRPAVTQ